MMQLLQVCAAVNGQLFGSDGQVVELDQLEQSQRDEFDLGIEVVGIDTRKPLHNGLFVALKGPRFDAHDYLDSALNQGAIAVLTERYVAVDCLQIVVQDSYAALTAMAHWWRRQHELLIVAVTGSVGKTSVKEMLASILQQQAPTLSTLGNLNNEIGVPLTLLRLRAEHRFAVIEMGMNEAGEISRLTNLVEPSIALVNNAAEAHLEGLGSLSAVAAAKGEIFQGLQGKGIAIVNADDSYSNYWKSLVTGREVLSFGLEKPAEVSATYFQNGDHQQLSLSLVDETVSVTLAGHGRHNVMNALAAASAALAAGVSSGNIVAGLEAYAAVGGRLKAYKLGDTTLFDDTYNANPASTKAALSVIADFSDSVAILGDMGELGAGASSLHRDVGQFAAQQNVSALWCCGQFAQHYVEAYIETGGDDGKAFSDQQHLLKFIGSQAIRLASAKAILVKGSRSAKMENVSAALLSQYEQQTDTLNQHLGGSAC